MGDDLPSWVQHHAPGKLVVGGLGKGSQAAEVGAADRHAGFHLDAEHPSPPVLQDDIDLLLVVGAEMMKCDLEAQTRR